MQTRLERLQLEAEAHAEAWSPATLVALQKTQDGHNLVRACRLGCMVEAKVAAKPLMMKSVSTAGGFGGGAAGTGLPGLGDEGTQKFEQGHGNVHSMFAGHVGSFQGVS